MLFSKVYLKEAIKLAGRSINSIGKLPALFPFYAPKEFILIHFIAIRSIFRLLIWHYVKVILKYIYKLIKFDV